MCANFAERWRITGTLGALTEYEAFLLRSVRKIAGIKSLKLVNALLRLQHSISTAGIRE
jgi:hypothetical protein